MNIKNITIEKTNDKKEFDKNGNNWFFKLEVEDGRKFGFELKPVMTLRDVVFEFVKFSNLLIVKIDE